MSLAARASLVAVLSLNLTGAATAAGSVRLSSLAAASGYTYQWLATEGGVTLQRAGLVIILHAGYPIYEVNATPIQADSPPQYERGDLVVSHALAERLRRIANAYPQATRPAAAPSSPAVTFDRPESSTSGGGVLTITARQIPGSETLALNGTAPAKLPVTITLTAELSKELPIVVISRTTVMSASDGSYSAVASINQNSRRGTTIAATATSVTGATSAVARIIVGPPSPLVNSVLDGFPPK